jgi:long-chain acyl-CoA synthetase
MSSDAIENIVAKSAAKQLVLGTGRDAPDPRDAKLERFPTTTVDALTADPDDTFPSDWEAQLAAWPLPGPEEIWELIFTSGTTGTPKGVMLAHDNILAGIQSFHTIVPPMDHRIVSLLPVVAPARAGGRAVLRPRRRSGHPLPAQRQPARDLRIAARNTASRRWSSSPRCSTCSGAPSNARWEKSGRARQFAWLRGIARRLPMGLRRVVFRSVHRASVAGFGCSSARAPSCRPHSSRPGRTWGVRCSRGTAPPRRRPGRARRSTTTASARVGRPGVGHGCQDRCRWGVQFRGPTLFKGYWDEPALTAEAFTADGWYKSGDIGHFDDGGRLILSGRKKDIIVLPNGFNVYPEDIENALRIAGIRESVVLETSPGGSRR